MRYFRLYTLAVLVLLATLFTRASSISNGGGGGGGGGTGNAAANVTTTFSISPTFTCPSATAGTIVNFTLSTALTANITSSTLTGCTNGSMLNFIFTQDATGGRTVSMPALFDAAPVHPAANASTKCTYFLDSGANGRLTGGGCVATVGYGYGVTIAAPAGTPPTGSCYSWFDNTSNGPAWKCNNVATVITMSRTIASGTTALPIAAIAANACSAAATTAVATGALTTDAPEVSFATDPTGVLGYGGGTNGGVTINPWPTANQMNFKLCNQTASSITPGALNVNWRVVR
jgi:hypothetical protein